MQGYVLVDAARGRLASVDGTLFKEVGFGWEISDISIAAGGSRSEQQEVGDNLWAVSSRRCNSPERSCCSRTSA